MPLSNFYIFSRDRVSPFGQSGLELLISSDPPTSASQSAGITGMVSPRCPDWSPTPGLKRFALLGLSMLELPYSSAANTLAHESLNLSPGWSAVVPSRFTATSDSQVQVILLPQPQEQLGLKAWATTPS
ncbi:hypothetical protein AAY473_007566 [Plecturocebus cupreus]